MKFLFKLLIIFLFATQSFASSQQIGVIGFVIGKVFNQKGEELKVGDPISVSYTHLTLPTMELV